jgi:electron transfer flavoprotein beta subunit
MKFLVCIKQVPDVTGNMQSGRMVLNAYDASAVEEALILTAGTDSEIHLVLIGQDSAKETIRKALAMGADSATHIIAQDAEKMDSGTIATRLASFCREIEFDIILCGKQSQDSDAGLTGSMLAAHLELPYATNAVGLALQEGHGGIIVTRQGDSGQEILHLPFPSLVTCSNDMNNPRIPSLKGIMQSKKKPIETRPFDGDETSATYVLEYIQPESRDPACILEGDDNEKVQALVTALIEESGVF